MAAISNLYIDQGTDYSTVVTVTSVNGVPVNLTGQTAASQMRKSYSSSTAFTFTCTVLNPTAGQIRLFLPASVSEQMTAGRWLYDIEITETSSGVKKRVVEGIVTLTPQITQI